jgi:hypothetical protein
MATDPIGPAVKPRVKQLLSSESIGELAELITTLDDSGAQFSGTLEFMGHFLPVAYDHTTECHVIGIN